MDGVKSSSRVVVIAATNRPDALDDALRRGGRFEKEIDIGIPDEKGRLEILMIHTRDMKIAPDVRLEDISKDTHGFVGADLSQLCQQAGDECVKEYMKYFDWDEGTIDAKVLNAMEVT